MTYPPPIPPTPPHIPPVPPRRTGMPPWAWIVIATIAGLVICCLGFGILGTFTPPVN